MWRNISFFLLQSIKQAFGLVARIESRFHICVTNHPYGIFGIFRLVLKYLHSDKDKREGYPVVLVLLLPTCTFLFNL